MTVSYVLPLRSATVRQDLTPYLRRLAGRVEVIVVDGSDPEVFAQHHELWAAPIHHLPVEPVHRTPMGKVGGVLTGIHAATHPLVVVADEDVRHDAESLETLTRLLAHADVVIPQNVFSRWPWHARWDGARSLVHRAVTVDWPGTLGLRRDALLAAGGYSGEALFENLELARTVTAAGGRVVSAPGLFVDREPPTTRQFVSQRIRQAYDELARPGHLLAALLLLPLTVIGGRRAALALAAGALAAAAAGRRRAGGTGRFPAGVVAFAPLWLAERAVAVWLAVAARLLLGGVPYGDTVLRTAASSRRSLRATVGRSHGAAA